MTRETEVFIINALRESTTRWSGRAECLRRHREQRVLRIGRNGKPVLKWFWQCQACKDWFKDISMMEVDHVVEVGPFNGNWDHFVRRLFCDQSNLVPLCIVCHKRKTALYLAAPNRYKRKVLDK